MSNSDDCSSGLHDFCNRCDCDCHGYEFTLEDIKTLYKLLEHQYISHDNPMNHQVLDRISKILREHECQKTGLSP